MFNHFSDYFSPSSVRNQESELDFFFPLREVFHFSYISYIFFSVNQNNFVDLDYKVKAAKS